MNNKKLIANALLTIAANSTTEIIDSSDNKELITAAEKIGLVIPSPDLSVIKTVYAEIDKVNLNGVILPRKAVEKGIKTLVGKQINWEHDGAGRICGYTIAATINGDKIEIIGVIFKSLFPEEMETLEEKFAAKKLAVSFEIWNKNMKGESVVSQDKDGNLIIDPILFHGTGLLLSSKPACPEAKVFKFLASDKLIIDAEKIAEKVFNENLIYASFAIEKEEIKEKSKNQDNKEDMMEEAVNGKPKTDEERAKNHFNISDDDWNKLSKEEKQKYIDKLPPRGTGRGTAEELPKEEKKEEKIESTEAPKIEEKAKEETKTEAIAPVAETNLEPAKVEEPKVEDKKEEVKVEEIKEEASTITVTQEKVIVDEVKPEGEVITTETKTEQTVVNDAGNEVQKVEEITKTIVTYTFEQVQEEVRLAKEEKDKEIAILMKELETLKTEFSKKNQDIETVKAKKDEIKTPLDLEVGEVKVKGEDEYVKIRKSIDKKAFGEKK